MPFDVMGKHRKWKGSVQGLEYLVFNLFGQNDDDLILLFFSSSFQSVVAGAEAMGPLYEDNVDSAAIIDLQADTENVISSRFHLFYSWSGHTLRAILTIDGGCSLRWHVQGQIFDDDLDRYIMHSVVIEPPSCYRCFSCGLCGDFNDHILMGMRSVTMGLDPTSFNWDD